MQQATGNREWGNGSDTRIRKKLKYGPVQQVLQKGLRVEQHLYCSGAKNRVADSDLKAFIVASKLANQLKMKRY